MNAMKKVWIMFIPALIVCLYVVIVPSTAEAKGVETGYVIDGCLHHISSTTTAQIDNCDAFISSSTGLVAIEETNEHTVNYNDGDGTYWLIIHKDTNSTITGWNNIPGSHYLWQHNDTIVLPEMTFRPDIPSDAMLVGKITVTDDAITQVLDLRDDNPYLEQASLSSPLFGSIADCGVSDNTDALQSAINNAAARRVKLEIPSGCYSYSGVLYLHYDDHNNPNYPSFSQRPGMPAGLPQNGRLIIEGSGHLGFTDLQSNRADMGTLLISTDPNGPSISMNDQDEMKISNLTSAVLRNLSIKANNDSWIVLMDGAVDGTYLENVSLQQNNLDGGCMLIEDTYVQHFQNVYCDGPADQGAASDEMGTGTGIAVVHRDSNGGLIRFTNVNVRQFDTCWQIGEQPGSDNPIKNLATVTLAGYQASSCRINVDVGNGVNGLSLENGHNEEAREVGLWIRNNARAVTVKGGQFHSGHMGSSGALIRLGDQNLESPESDYYGVNIEGARFILTKGYTGIDIDTSSPNSAVNIGMNVFDGGPSGNTPNGTAINCSGSGIAEYNQINIGLQSFPEGINGDKYFGCENIGDGDNGEEEEEETPPDPITLEPYYSENFDGIVSLPSEWSSSLTNPDGNITISTSGSFDNEYLRVEHVGNTPGLKIWSEIPEISEGEYVFEADIKVDSDALQANQIILGEMSSRAVTINFRDHAFWVYDGGDQTKDSTAIYSDIENDKWYHVKITFNKDIGEYNVSLSDAESGQQLAVKNGLAFANLSTITSITLFQNKIVNASDNILGIDNISIQNVVPDLPAETPTQTPPTDLLLSSTVVSEDAPSGTTIGTFSAIDADIGDTYVYSMADGDGTNDADNDQFIIQDNKLMTIGPLDYESQESYHIYVSVSDSVYQYEKAFTIGVINVTEPPTDIALSGSKITEDALIGTTVGTLSAIDPDANESYTYTLISGSGDDDNSSFMINDDALLTAQLFDYELKQSYNIRVKVTDAVYSFEKTFTIHVTEDEETPPDPITLEPYYSENFDGIVSLPSEWSSSLTNPDGNITISTSGSFDNEYLRVEHVGNTPGLKIWSEIPEISEGEYVFEADIKVDSDALQANQIILGEMSSRAVTINFRDHAFWVYDGGDQTKDSTAIYSDIENDKWYHVKITFNKDIGEYNVSLSDAESGQQLAVKNGLAFANLSNITSITLFQNKIVNASDNILGIDNISIQKVVPDLPAETPTQTPPTDLLLSSTVVSEDAPSGTTIGTFSAIDADIGDTYVYSMADGDGTNDADNDQFIIQDNKLMTIGPLDYESQESYHIYVSVSDSVYQYEKAFTIHVTEITEVPRGESSGDGIIFIPPTHTDPDIIIGIDGDEQGDLATASVLEDNGLKTIIVTLDPKKMADKLVQEDANTIITIPVSTSSSKVVGEINGETVKVMENYGAVLVVETPYASYTLPAAQINIDNVSTGFGKQVALSDITVKVEISNSSENTVNMLADTANEQNFTLIVPPVDFTVTATHENKTIAVKHFTSYVEREIKIPNDVDPNKITTAVILHEDGTVTHVPTYIFERDGQYYAKIDSLSNSTYVLIWNEQAFTDVDGHWANEEINAMASRKIVSGMEKTHFQPDTNVTRAEFATMIVHALGISEVEQQSVFKDIHASDWFNETVIAAYEYDLIGGYEDHTFHPQQQITREEAFSIVSRAMMITGLEVDTANTEQALASFVDNDQIGIWARADIAALVSNGLVTGRPEGLQPKSNITRAEAAIVIYELLIKSHLINE